jgi:hypothetical protein
LKISKPLIADDFGDSPGSLASVREASPSAWFHPFKLSFVHEVHLEEVLGQRRVGRDPHTTPRFFHAYLETRRVESAIVVDNIGATEKEMECVSRGMS